MHLVTGLRSAPFGRHAAGASALSMLTMNVLPPTTPVQLTAALSTLGTLTLAVIVRQPQPDYFVTSWRLHMRRQSGTTLTPATRDLTSSCVVATP